MCNHYLTKAPDGMTPCTQRVWGTQGAPRQSPRSRLPCRPRQGQDCFMSSIDTKYGGFHKWGVPPNGCFTKENPFQMDDD